MDDCLTEDMRAGFGHIIAGAVNALESIGEK